MVTAYGYTNEGHRQAWAIQQFKRYNLDTVGVLVNAVRQQGKCPIWKIDTKQGFTSMVVREGVEDSVIRAVMGDDEVDTVWLIDKRGVVRPAHASDFWTDEDWAEWEAECGD